VVEAPPRTLLGELTVLPRPPSWIWGGEVRGKGRGRGKVGKGRGGRNEGKG